MTSHKRKSLHSAPTQNEPPPKKARPDTENDSSAIATPTTTADYGPLPPILPEYETVVFTHASLASQPPDSTKMVNYERLEFLGDAQIEHIASLVLWERFPSANPKKLSSMRETLVRNETLQQFAKLYHFDTKLQTTISNNNRPGDRERQKIHADVFEAYVAACILSDPLGYYHGFVTAKDWLSRLWEPLLGQMALTTMNPKRNDTKSKEELGKSVLMPGVKLSYVEEKRVIFDRNSGVSTFHMGVYLDGLGFDNQHLGSGSGDSKNIAGQEAASNALKNPLMNEIKQRRSQQFEQRKAEQNGVKAESG